MIAIIVGSSDDLFNLSTNIKSEVKTPYGDMWYITIEHHKNVIFLLRHGTMDMNYIYPQEINYKANMFGLKQLGCSHIYTFSSVGILNPCIKPFNPIVITDLFYPNNQLHDGSVCSFNKHHLISNPIINQTLMTHVKDTLNTINNKYIIYEGVYAHVQGPRTKTYTENKYYISLGIDVNSMTLGPELVLAKELGIPCVALGVGHVDTNGFSNMTVSESLIKSSVCTSDAIECILSSLLQNIPLIDDASLYKPDRRTNSPFEMDRK
jgi:5'-methylthioadenosine phosphorylase